MVNLTVNEFVQKSKSLTDATIWTKYNVAMIHGDCREIIPDLVPRSNVAIIADPQYGISLKTNYKDRKRGKLAEANNFPPIEGDNEPFNPVQLLSFPVVVLFGADHYATRLPETGSFHIWDKLDGLTSKREVGFNDNSDCEFIWSSKPGASRIFRHRWMGAMKGSEHNQRRVHPTQKPVDLMMQLIKYFVPDESMIILDPYAGSGPIGKACIRMSRPYIGIEINETYYNEARRGAELALFEFHKEPPLDKEPTFENEPGVYMVDMNDTKNDGVQFKSMFS